MNVALRIKRLRELQGWKQMSIASEMGVTQQAYSAIEQAGNNAKLETLRKFCAAAKVELPFLVAFDAPITEENLESFGKMKYSEVLADYKRLKEKLEVYEGLLNRSFDREAINPSKQIKLA